MDNETIERLANEAIERVTVKKIYDMSLKRVDFEEMKTVEDLTAFDVAATFAVAGFDEGIRFALQNIDIVKEKSRWE